MATITIHGREYGTEQLSEAAKAQITNIQIVDQKLTLLQREIGCQRRSFFVKTSQEITIS